MLTVVISVNGTPGSNDNVALGSTVQLTATVMGFPSSAQQWTISDLPDGSQAALSDPTIQNPTFVADCEGTYFIQILLNPTDAQGNQATDTVIVAVRDLQTGQRVPAAGETTEDSLSQGWRGAENALEELLLELCADPGTTVWLNGTGSSLPVGTPVIAQSATFIKQGLPGQAPILVATALLGTREASQQQLCGIVEGEAQAWPGEADAVPNGGLARVRVTGLYRGGPLGSAFSAAVVGAEVFVDDSGALSPTSGTYACVIGTVIAGTISTNDASPWTFGGSDTFTISDGTNTSADVLSELGSLTGVTPTQLANAINTALSVATPSAISTVTAVALPDSVLLEGTATFTVALSSGAASILGIANGTNNLQLAVDLRRGI